MGDEFKTRFTIEADEAIRLLKSIADAEDRLARETENLGRKSREQSKENENATKIFGALRGEVMGLIGAMTGGLGLIEIWNSYKESIEAANRALQENAKLTRAAAEARLDLAALRGYEKPEDVAFINQAAAFSGRDPGEIARTMTIIGGAIGPENTAGIQALTMQVGAKAQQTTTPMAQLAGPFVQLFKQTGDARVAANVLEGAIDAAEEPDPGKVGEGVAKMLGMRSISGMGVGQSAGYAAAASGLGISSEVASTSLRNLVLGIRGEGTPEGTEIMAREGINRDDFTVGLRQILSAAREGRITRQELESIGGKEGLPVLSALVNAQTEAQFFGRVNAVTGAETAQGMLLSKKSEQIFGSDAQRLNLLAKQMESSSVGTKGSDTSALKAGAVRATIEAVLAQAQASGTISAANVQAKLEAFDSYVAQGIDPIKAAEMSEMSGTFSSNFTKASAKFGPELGLPAYDALRLGPNTDPNTQRQFLPLPAGGNAVPGMIDPSDPYTLSSFSKSIVIINNSVVNTSDPAKDASPAQNQP